MPTTPGAAKRYRLCRDLTVPKGNTVVYVSKMKKDVERVAMAIFRISEDIHGEMHVYFDDALRAGLIEEISDGVSE